MTNIDRALRTLSRLQNAAPALAAARIGEVTTLLMRLNAENEYLNARLLENQHISADFPEQTSSRDRFDHSFGPTDTSIEELFGVDRASAVDLFADLDSTLFTNEMPAIASTSEMPSVQREFPQEESALEVYEDLQELLNTHSVTELSDELAQLVELTNAGRRALEIHRQLTMAEEEISDLPTLEELLAHVNDLLKPTLIALQGDIEGLVDGRLGRLTSNQADTLRVMSDTTDGMLTLLDSLMVIRQLREHSFSLQVTSFNPVQLLDTAQQMVLEPASRRDHQVTVQADQALPLVRADFDRTLNILLDMLDNAIRYTPNDGIIRVSADSMGSHVLFTVADNGVGFSADDSEYIGTPFWRALHEPLVREHPGTGLRLFLAKQVLALQEGEMFFSGEANFGSSFSFTLPAS